LDKLRDIKPIVEVNDYSFYIFLAVVLGVILIIIAISYFVYKKYKKPKYHFDLSDSKKTAYKLIELIRDKEGSEKYIEKLHSYTYKKEVPPFDETLFEEIKKKFKL